MLPNKKDFSKSVAQMNEMIPLKLDPRRTCLLVIDMQKGFADKNGFVARQGMNINGVRATIPVIKKATEFCHEKGVPIFYTQQIHVSEAFNDEGLHKLHQFVGRDLAQASKSEGYRLARRGTGDAEFLDEIRPSKDDYIIPKNKPSAFFQSMFEVYLKYLDIKTILVTGCNTGYCVVSTLTDAWAREYDTITVEDGVGDPDEGLTKALLGFFDRRFGRVLPFESIQKVLKGYPRVVKVKGYNSS